MHSQNHQKNSIKERFIIIENNKIQIKSKMSNEENQEMDSDSKSDTSIQLSKKDLMSTSSPYMILPESDTSEMRLVIEGSDDTLLVTANRAENNIVLKNPGTSQCCILI